MTKITLFFGAVLVADKNQIRRCLALIGLALALTGWSTGSAAWHKGAYHSEPEPWEVQSEPGSAQKVKLRFTAIDPARTEFKTRMTEDHCCRIQTGVWRSMSGKYPRARFVFLEVVSKLKYIGNREKLESFLQEFFEEEITLYETVKTNAPKLEYGRFRLSDAECIGVVKYFGEQFFGGGIPPAPGNKFYMGYYCDREKHAIEPILNAISVSE